MFRSSVVVCCYNSGARLPATLRHLKVQSEAQPWETIVVDNCSTDGTAAVAHRAWDGEVAVPLRVVQEPKLGLGHARCRGMAEARSEIVCFIDDDNWVRSDWIGRVQRVFDAHPEVAACGGPIEEVCERVPPDWFFRFKGNFAIWSPKSSAGYFHGGLCGAGLCIRKSAWTSLLAGGFRPMLTDRKGDKLSSGGDFELTQALLLAGWKLWYDPALLVRHFIPLFRLNWSYLKKLNNGFGQQSVHLDAYELALKRPLDGSSRPSWFVASLRCLRQLMRHSGVAMLDLLGMGEGRNGVLLFGSQLNRLQALLKARKRYDASFVEIGSAKWNRHCGNSLDQEGIGFKFTNHAEN